jgi:heme A synthase
VSLPTQSALLLVPASGSCVDVVAAGSIAARLCPWNLDAMSALGKAVLPSDPLELSSACWIMLAVPPIAAFLGGRRAGARQAPVHAIARGVGAGIAFALLAVLGAMFASPRIVVPSLAGWLPVEFDASSWAEIGLLCIWGVLGGVIGGWTAGRTYDEPGLPSPTSA